MPKDILIHPSMKAVVQDGSKRITIRAGERDYKPGNRIRVGCDSYGWYPVEVTDVRHTALGDVTSDEFQDDGFATFKEMRLALDQFYPGIDYHAPVTVIRWEYV